MSKLDTGGPVYPQDVWDGNSVKLTGGITRRDQCADRIAAAIISSGEPWWLGGASSPAGRETLQELSYQVADALIAEGRKGAE